MSKSAGKSKKTTRSVFGKLAAKVKSPDFSSPELKSSHSGGGKLTSFTGQKTSPGWGGGANKAPAPRSKKMEAFYGQDELWEAKTEHLDNFSYMNDDLGMFESVSNDSNLEGVDLTIPTKESKLMYKQMSIDVNEQLHDSGISTNRRATLLNRGLKKFVQSVAPPSLNIPYNLDLNENVPVRGVAIVISLHWTIPDIEGEIKPLKEALRALKYDVIGTYGVSKQDLLDMKKDWMRQLQSLKYPSFVCVVIGSSDIEQNFVTTDNQLLSRDEILQGLDSGFPQYLPKLFFFNSLLPPTATNITKELPNNTLYMHTYFDTRIYGSKAVVTHPFLETFYDIIRTRGNKDEFQEMVRRAKHVCLSSVNDYKALNIRQHSTLQRPLFLLPDNLIEAETNVLQSYFSLKQAYPMSNTSNHGLVVLGLIEDASWTQTAKYQKSTRSIYNNLKTTLQFYNLKVSTFELRSKLDYKNELLREVRRKNNQYDLVIIILLGSSTNENHIKFRTGPEILLIGEVLDDLQVIGPDIPKLLFISQLLHLDSRENVPSLLRNNKMQSEEKAPFIHNSYVFHAKNKMTSNLEGTFLSSLTEALKCKFRKLEFTKIASYMRLNSAEKNLLPHFLEMNNLESPLYLLPEELKISAELLSRGEEFASLYQEALDDGLELLRFYRLMVVGPEGVGKTSLLRALTGQPFEANQTSTPFIDKFDVQIHKISKDWKQNEDLDSYADRLLDTKEQMAVNYVVGKLKENIRKESTSTLIEPDMCPLDLYEFCIDDPSVFTTEPSIPMSTTNNLDNQISGNAGLATLDSIPSSSNSILATQDSMDVTKSFTQVYTTPIVEGEKPAMNQEFEIPPDDIIPDEQCSRSSVNKSPPLLPIESEDTPPVTSVGAVVPPPFPEVNPAVLPPVHSVNPAILPPNPSTKPVVSPPVPPVKAAATTLAISGLIPPPPADMPPEFLPKISHKSIDSNATPNDDVIKLETLDLKENLIDIPINKIYSTLNQDAESKNVEHPDFLTAWDFAGQNYLYCFHSLFLSPRAIYLLLIDLAVEDLNADINIREERKDRLSQRSYAGVPKTYLEAIEFWLNAIYSVARMPLSEHYSRHSKVVFIFSRADKCEEPKARAIEHFETIQDYMIGKSNAFSIVHMNIDDPIVISCKPGSPYLQNINQIKDLLEGISDTVAFRQEIPIRWLELARAILHERSPFISHRRLELLCEKHGCTKDFSPLISLFHDIGFFFYQKGIVIRDIQTFLNIIYHVISPQYGDKIVEKAKDFDRAFLKQDLLDCQNAGRITNKLLNHILLLDDDISHVREEVVQLLLTYGVIIDSQAETRNPFYYVPYLMTGNLEELSAVDDDINTAYISVDDKSSQTFYLYFPDGFIPAAVYFSLLSQCLKFNKLKGQPQPLLGFDCARFQLSHDHSFILDFCSNKCYIRVLFNSALTHSYHLTERLNFLHFIQTHISEIQGNIIPCGNAAKIAVECRCRELYLMKKLVQPCVFLDQLLSTPTGYRTSWCHTSQKYEEWNHLFIDKDFYYDMLRRQFNSDELAKFIFDNIDVFEEHLNILTLSRQLYFGGLFTAIDLSMLLSKEKNEMTAEGILAQLLHQSNNWALRFYLCLQRETSHSGHLFLVQFVDSFLFQKHLEQQQQQQQLAAENSGEGKRKRFADIRGSIMPSEDEFDRYKMNCNPHGIAMIVNIETFKDDVSMTRKGSHHDFIQLRETFEQLQYVVLGFEDLTKRQFKKQLLNVRKMDHHKYDSFICVIMSHGDEKDNVITHDKLKISKQEILNEFKPEYCPGLIKKPKIFIFQACRGSKNEFEPAIGDDVDGVEHTEPDLTNEGEDDLILTDELFLTREDPSVKLITNYDRSITVHHQSDTFIGNSTVQNYVSYRDPSKGSMFIQSFCKVIQYTRYEEFQHIMNEVRRRVSMLSKKYVQCTEDINHLTAKLYFF
ncbi:caspase-3 [Oopsacas minuta]|uniref:Caspase-3 n=1 Tax=Oopsacas minuta TaxID=111878 RepID=A0AAV7KBA3_9METZ|nr:caspase-3 [Oopsacas minuta]